MLLTLPFRLRFWAVYLTVSVPGRNGTGSLGV
jgi:hypothetical protein